MIEVPENSNPTIPCYRADSTTPVSEEEFRSFGARRRSAIQLCRACRDALAFVISQDGDLRLVVREHNKVRFFDDAPLW
jgi:hypothetical protein